jgi:hypothetical protein
MKKSSELFPIPLLSDVTTNFEPETPHVRSRESVDGWWAVRNSPMETLSPARIVGVQPQEQHHSPTSPERDSSWVSDNEVDHATSFKLPEVHVRFMTRRGQLLLGIRVDGSDDPFTCEARLLQISLDNVVVARNRGTEALRFERRLLELSPGRHRVQFVCHFDSGDMIMYHRLLTYNGPTCREPGEKAEHILNSHGSGVVSPKHPVMWRIDEAYQLPVTIILQGARRAALFIQACRTAPGSYEPPISLDAGEARVCLRGSDRYFIVGVHGSTDTPYDLLVECAQHSETDDRLLWTRAPHTPAAYAVCVGLSKYSCITQLHWADADAVSWLQYLGGGGYEFRLFGDGMSSYAPFTPSALGSEMNIRRFVRSLADVVGEGDMVTFTDSGHGAADGKGHSWLCCLDENGTTDGEYMDTDLADDFSVLTQNGARVFLFIDACHSFGFEENMRQRCPDGSWFLATACTSSGVGFDDPAVHHGAFTYAFLVKGLQGRFRNLNPPLGEVFDYAKSIYKFKQEARNMPQCAGNRDIRLFS